MNAYRKTNCSCWLINRCHCVFCSLIKFHVTLPVGTLNGQGFSARSGLVTVTGGWHQWRARTPWLIGCELIAKTAFSTQKCIFRLSTQHFYPFYFKHLWLRWKAKNLSFSLCLTFNGRTNVQCKDGVIVQVLISQCWPADICCHF